MKTIYIFGLSLLSISLFAQKKTEKEYRISVDLVPERAVLFIKSAYASPEKVKWYYEETSGKKSYEAKITHKEKSHSIEFDTSGRLEDIEMKIEWDQIPINIKKNIEEYLIANYQKYEIQRMQMQLSGNEEIVRKSMMEQNYSYPGIIRYEIEYSGKQQNSHELWEGVFNESGLFIEKREVELLPTQNLNY